MIDSNAVRANTMFGDYDIIETVGQGGMGIVYRATDTNLNREVALKVLKDDLREHSAIVARFQREAEAYATLNHPNIVHIYSVGAVGKIPYIAMQMIHGMPLSALMKKERRIEWKRALRIGIQVAEALGSAHAGHIIHRDIKPGNILIASDDHAYVTDFGIAKVLTAETQLTVEGSRLGTPQYMSPERCKNEEVTASSDLYSLGVLLFQMITGRLPYESKDPIALVRKIVSDPPHRMTDFMPEVPDDVERLIAFLIEKKTADRPQSAEEWILLCQRVIDGKPLVEDDSGLEESLRQFRESQATPTPTPVAIGEPYKRPKKDPLFATLGKRLETMSSNAATVAAALIAVLVFGAAGLLVANSTKPDRAANVAKMLGDIDSGWNADSPLAQFRNETPGVSLIELGNPNWRPVPIATDVNGSLLAALTGSVSTEWAGRHGLMWIDVEGQTTRMVMAPTPVNSLHFVGQRPSDNAELVDIDGQWYAFSAATPELTPQRESIYSALGKNANDFFSSASHIRMTEGFVVVAARDIASDTHGIYRFQAGGSVGDALVSNRNAIASMRLAGSNGVVWSEELATGGVALFYINNLEPNAQPLQLVAGLSAQDSFDIHPDGSRIIAARLKNDGSSELALINLAQPTVSRRVVDAMDAHWSPEGNALLALAPDRKGVSQIWQVEAAEPFQSKQITFLRDGVRSLGMTSGNRLIAVSGSETRPGLVQIDFADLP